MNATLLYTQLSHEILKLDADCNDEKLSNFMKNDRGFYKLRSLLLCRACRDLCIEPFSTTFCKHLVCKTCLEGKKLRILGCKWCRNDEDMVEDIQSKILIGLYKQICAILKDLVTRTPDTPGTSTSSNTREKLLTFLNEGCSIPDFVVPKIEDSVSNKQPLPKRSRRSRREEANITSCPPCCCTCQKQVKTNQTDRSNDSLTKSDISNDPIKVTAAQSSEERICMVRNSPGYASDSVTSTVPDSLPSPDKRPIPRFKNHNKDGGSVKSKNILSIKEQPPKRTKRGRGRPSTLSKFSKRGIPLKSNVIDTMILKPLKKYEADLPTTTKQEQNSLSSKQKITQSPLKRKSLHHVKEKLLKEKERQLKEKIQEIKTAESPSKIESPPRIQPLKLTVQKTNNSNISYKIQFKPDIENESEETKPAETDSDKEDDISDFLPKTKRKATFVTNYALFSDESDFEPDNFKKKAKWTWKPLENRDSCSCGASSNVKYFTDICKRARCPCYSQGRACVNCKCRFCSNPYLLEDEEICSDSDTTLEGSQIIKNEIEDVDVETM